MNIGYLDHFTGIHIWGWLGSFVGEVLPFITANGKPCHITSATLSRPDVADATGLDAQVGFVAEVPHLELAHIEFKLYAITNSGVKLIDSKTFVGASIDPKRFCSVFDALKIAREPDAVAITCSEGTNNAISRAHTLYKIVNEQRPAVIITFDPGLSEFGLWQPLINSDAKVLIIPWNERAIYFELFRRIGLSFDTIWICKPCYSSYELSRHVANENTNFIQDIDNNESEQFSINELDAKSYRKLSELMAQPFLDKISQRSIASINLDGYFRGTVVRNARTQYPINRTRQTDLTQEIRIGYVGTVTPETGLIEAARIINFINKTRNYNIKFVVGGTYNPATIRNELESLNCEVHNHVDLNNLSNHMQTLDALLTGFPVGKNTNKYTEKTKITSKIGDALCNSRPVLVPFESTVKDLENIAGIYLFSQDTFLEQLSAAITNKDSIVLPVQFTLAHNYKIFRNLEQMSAKEGPTYEGLFGHQNKSSHANPLTNNFEKLNIVLIWKQHDAGLYGRRVDQIARSLAANGTSSNIISLEIITKEQLKIYTDNSYRIDSDNQYIYADFFDKKMGIFRDGITYQNIFSDETESFTSKFNKFLIQRNLFPTNTIFILFPAITEFSQLLRSIDGYRIVSDIVDNQLSWEKGSPLPLLNQYLTFNNYSDKVVFNSEENMKFFIDNQLCPKEKACFIPNWYRLPTTFTPIKPTKERAIFNILYSGNMNDRIDWELIKALHDQTDESIKIHLIGSADQALSELTDLLEGRHKFIYHGPMREMDLLEFASSCDIAIMPHTADIYSKFMNPMKLNMYTAIGLHCISTDISGVDRDNPLLTVCTTKDQFINRARELSENPPLECRSFLLPSTSREALYMQLISDVANI